MTCAHCPAHACTVSPEPLCLTHAEEWYAGLLAYHARERERRWVIEEARASFPWGLSQKANAPSHTYRGPRVPRVRRDGRPDGRSTVSAAARAKMAIAGKASWARRRRATLAEAV